jgi:hypothetical protein
MSCQHYALSAATHNSNLLTEYKHMVCSLHLAAAVHTTAAASCYVVSFMVGSVQCLQQVCCMCMAVDSDAAHIKLEKLPCPTQ